MFGLTLEKNRVKIEKVHNADLHLVPPLPLPCTVTILTTNQTTLTLIFDCKFNLQLMCALIPV